MSLGRLLVFLLIGSMVSASQHASSVRAAGPGKVTTPAVSAGKKGFGTVFFCEEHKAVTVEPIGVSLVSLPSNQAQWKVLQDRLADVGPAVAGNTVAIVTDTWSWIYGFSMETGKLLWKKEYRTNQLGFDGAYFYAFRRSHDDFLVALRPESGTEAWSVNVGRLGPAPASFLSIYRSLLFTDSFVVDLGKRAVIHKWPAYPHVSSISIDENGEILARDSGGITVYDKNFKPLRTIHLDDGTIVKRATVENDFLEASYNRKGAARHGTISLLTLDGERKWQIEVTASDRWLDTYPFALRGGDVLIIEPGNAGNMRRLTSRKLSTGVMNWTTEDGNFAGPPVVCGDAVYVQEFGRGIRTFNATDGVERGAVPKPGKTKRKTTT